MTSTTPRSSQAAFTLIEMIVVLVVLALAMAAIFPAIGNLMAGSSRGAASGQATGEAGLVGKMIEEDIKAAVGDRSTGERSDAGTFTGATALRTATIPALTAGAGSNLYSDIVAAGPTRLILNVDALAATAGVEQVEWVLTQNSPACGETDASNNNWCLRRIVRAPGGGAVLAAEVATKSRGTYPTTTSCGRGLPAAVRVFCYQESYPGAGGNANYVWNGGWTPNCSLAWTTDGNSPNSGSATRTLTSPARIPTRHNQVEPASSISRLDRITTVGASVLAGGGFGKAGERSYENLETALRSRENEAYREAIMCGLRAGWGR
jgi:prepilin-type N-terminal cleavage/methylation domain-containing protein